MKKLGIPALCLFAIAVIAALLFISLSPQFGGKPTEAQAGEYARSANHRDGRFVNQVPTELGLGFWGTLQVLREFLLADIPDKEPSAPLPVRKVDPASLATRDSALERVTWFGHSTILLEIDGRKILFDPMFGAKPAPLPALAPGRFDGEPPIDIGNLPAIDAVIISHDHYDHLDYGSITRLKGKVDRFFVPLGVGAHLARWGVDASRIAEMDWGDTAYHAGLTMICAPARHFSGRGISDSFRTLWASWVIRTRARGIYFSGDSGYGPHFKEIGAAHGPFDFVMMECGQYDARWASIHMMAEESVRATREVGGRLMLPIHWGAFALAMHSWYDPAESVTREAAKAGLAVTTPRIGEPVLLGETEFPASPWWKSR